MTSRKRLIQGEADLQYYCNGNTIILSGAQFGQRCSSSRVVIKETQGAAAAGDETSRDQNDDVSFTFGEKLYQPYQPCIPSSTQSGS